MKQVKVWEALDGTYHKSQQECLFYDTKKIITDEFIRMYTKEEIGEISLEEIIETIIKFKECKKAIYELYQFETWGNTIGIEEKAQ